MSPMNKPLSTTSLSYIKTAGAPYDQTSWWQATRMWRWHILSLVIGLGSFAADAVLAAVFAGRPLSDWPSQILSTSAVVSASSITSKLPLSALVADSISQTKWTWFQQQEGRPFRDMELIDNASRSPWGCILWLSQRSGMTLITFAAAVTVLLTALGLFLQQLMVIDTRMIVDSAQTAHIPWV
ncbi:hypothetical protein GGR57DRAFT_509623 [Xylariaceae sp. FL1272]|nr:hypothetical protein GGR57DRAFT_509623 [Xylariaceae sp. FL1272]